MKKPTIIEIVVHAMDDAEIEKDFVFNSVDDLNKWWKSPYEYKQCWKCGKLISISCYMDICPDCGKKNDRFSRKHKLNQRGK